MFNLDVVMDLKKVELVHDLLHMGGNVHALTLTGGDPDHNSNDSTIAIKLHISELRMIHDKINDLLMENV